MSAARAKSKANTEEDAANAVFQIEGLTKERQAGGNTFKLTVKSLHVAQGEQIALVGQSGCGKSTLLDMLAMVLKPDEADQFLIHFSDGSEFAAMQAWERGRLDAMSDFRGRHMGYVLQSGGLLPFLSVHDNIGLSRRLLNLPDDGAIERLAEDLGILDQLRKRPDELSAGQRQRVAIARALAHEPEIVMADEPTAALDPINSRKVMEMFVGLARDLNVTLVLSSHDWDMVKTLGLRRIKQRTSVRKQGELVESIYSG